MRILDLVREPVDDGIRVAATFRFEHCDLPEQRIFASCVGPGAEDLQPSPDAFLLIGLPLACWMGEQRVAIEGTICTALRENLEEAMRLFHHWYERAAPVAIDPSGGCRATRPRPERRAAMLFSGGVDSLTTLRANRDAYPLDHPDSVQEALFLIGLNTYDRPVGAAGPVEPERLRAYESLVPRLRRLAEGADLEFTVLDTNARSLYPDWVSFREIGSAAAMLAHAHMLGRRITDILVSSTGYGVDPPPHGSHPALDGLYSTAAVRAWNTQPYMGRHEKLGIVAAWPEGLGALDVCFRFDPSADGPANCGTCSKCVRTMLGLLAHGRLADAHEFPCDDLTVEQVRAAPIRDMRSIFFLEPMVARLEAIGREDLAQVVRQDIHRWRTRKQPHRRVARAIRRALRGR